MVFPSSELSIHPWSSSGQNWKGTVSKARLYAQGHGNITRGADIVKLLLFGIGSVRTSLFSQKRIGHNKVGIGSAKYKNSLVLFILVPLRFISRLCRTGPGSELAPVLKRSKAAAKAAAKPPCPPCAWSWGGQVRKQHLPPAQGGPWPAMGTALGSGYFSFLHLRSYMTQTWTRAAARGKGLCSLPPFELATHIVLLFSHKRVFGNFVFYNNESGISVVMHIVIISLLCFLDIFFY